MYKVGLVGLGNIATGYSSPEDAAPYTHVGGINHSDKVELAAVADLSEEAIEKFKDKWGACFPQTKIHKDFQEMLDSEELDIIAICTRGPHHYQAMMDTLKARPKAIFLEKPPSCSLEEMDIEMAAAKAAGIPVTVSYSRHWGSHVLRMAELVKNGLIGDVKSVVGYCGQTFLSFASHNTDLICQFAGYCPSSVYARGEQQEIEVPEGYEPEPRLKSMIIEFKNGVIGTQIGERGDHGSFYCDVTGTNGRAHVPFYGKPAAFDKDNEPIDLSAYAIPAPASPFKLAYEQIAAHLDGGPLADCSDDNFIAVNEICFAGIESTLTDKRIEIPNINRTRKIFANG